MAHAQSLKTMTEQGNPRNINSHFNDFLSQHEETKEQSEHKLLVADAMLKQSEDTVDEVEAKLRKTKREKDILLNEMHEV